MKSLFVTTAIVLGATTGAWASDHWDSCVSKDGQVRIEEGRFFLGDEDYTQISNPKVIKVKVISKKTETCILKKSGKKVISLEQTITRELVKWGYKMNTNYTEVTCDRGGSGIPANDSCRE